MQDDVQKKKPTPKQEKSQADQSIAKFRCSKCLLDDVLHFNPQKYIFECTACGSDYLNPFAIGPWDKRVAVLEKLPDQAIASAYIIHTRDTDPVEPDTNYLEFIKSLHADDNLAGREIKDDWGLPTQATKKRQRRKKKVEDDQQAKVEVAQEVQ